jgi:serine/threonine protein phosphatase PrpC
MSDVLVSVSARTDVGMHRAGNEDSFLLADLTTGATPDGADVHTHQLGERGSLMIVSDGMGGAAAGEIASEMAVTTIRESLDEMPASMEIPNRLKAATEIANERIWNHSQDNPEMSGMGATLTAVLVQDTTAYVAQVGDSRAYLIRREQIKQLTKDQSLVQMLVDSGAISADQMDSVPQNVIMQALGTQPVVKVAMTAVQLFRNDCVVICSDGLSNKVTADELREAATSGETLTEACRMLIQKANDRGGEDNITVILARFDGESLHSASESSSITGSFRALDQGFVSEYFSANSAEAESQAEAMSQPGSDITGVLRIPDAAQLVIDEPEDDDDFGSRPTGDRPAFNAAAHTEVQTIRRRQSYALIIIFALISLLLLGATLYFFYSTYMKATPQNIDQPE